jgi:hypothetical protein
MLSFYGKVSEPPVAKLKLKRLRNIINADTELARL